MQKYPTMVFKAALLAALVKVLLATRSPFLCSGIYAVASLVSAFFWGVTLQAALLGTAITFILASLYFWLLCRYEDTDLLFWGIFIAGLFVGLAEAWI